MPGRTRKLLIHNQARNQTVVSALKYAGETQSSSKTAVPDTNLNQEGGYQSSEKTMILDKLVSLKVPAASELMGSSSLSFPSKVAEPFSLKAISHFKHFQSFKAIINSISSKRSRNKNWEA